MPGYKWQARARYTPINGVQETVVFTAGLTGSIFTETGFPTGKTVLTDVELDYKAVIDQDETINQSERPILRGYRPQTKLTFQVVDMTHYREVAKLFNRLMSPGWKVEIALDSSQTFREIILVKIHPVRRFKKKTIAGSAFPVTVRTANLLDQLMNIDDGAGW